MIKRLIIVFTLACFGLCAAGTSALAGMPKVKLGVQPWLGYGPWWIAESEGFFKKHGLDVNVINFTWDTDMGAAVASGNLHVIAAATNFLISLRAQGADLKGFLVLDAAYEADAILAPASVKSIKDLRGRSVAFEAGATSDLLINYALKQNGMTIKDVKAVKMAASDAGLALIAGRVDTAVTYEPYISAALKQDKNFKVVYTAAQCPGLISDLAVADAAYIKNNPQVIKALVLAWDDAVNYLRTHPEKGGQIIAKAVHSPMNEFKVAMAGVKIYSLKDNHEILDGEFQKSVADIGQIMKETNPKDIKTVPDPGDVLAVDLIRELSE